MRRCNVCNQDRPDSDYYGHHRKCRTCLVAQNRAIREKKREMKRQDNIAELLHNWPRVTA